MRAAGLVPLGVALGVLSGCAAVHPRTGSVTETVPSARESQARLRRQIALCRTAYREGTHFLAKAKCDEAARRGALLAAGNPDDLVEAYLASRAGMPLGSTAARSRAGRPTSPWPRRGAR